MTSNVEISVGPLASELVSAEDDDDVFGPLRALRERDGWVVLAGVGLTSGLVSGRFRSCWCVMAAMTLRRSRPEQHEGAGSTGALVNDLPMDLSSQPGDGGRRWTAV